jgi:hypothetical protein
MHGRPRRPAASPHGELHLCSLATTDRARPSALLLTAPAPPPSPRRAGATPSSTASCVAALDRSWWAP